MLHQDLSVAIKNGELSLHYQPQAASGDTVAQQGHRLQARRWMHPLRGFVSPADFIRLLESGLIVGPVNGSCAGLPRSVVAGAAADRRQPAASAVLHGDVNPRARDPAGNGLAPGRRLEITEGVLIPDFDPRSGAAAAAEGAGRAHLDGRFLAATRR